MFGARHVELSVHHLAACIEHHVSIELDPLHSLRVSEAIWLHDSAPLDSLFDVVGIEAYEFADLEERYAALGDQTPYESVRHAELFRESAEGLT